MKKPLHCFLLITDAMKIINELHVGFKCNYLIVNIVNICTNHVSKHVSSYFVTGLICIADFAFLLEH